MIEDIIREITDQLDESKETAETEMDLGTVPGLSEALCIIKSEIIGIDGLEELLDYDIDARYVLPAFDTVNARSKLEEPENGDV